MERAMVDDLLTRRFSSRAPADWKELFLANIYRHVWQVLSLVSEESSLLHCNNRIENDFKWSCGFLIIFGEHLEDWRCF